MTDGRDDGWRSDLRRVLAAWVHILAAAALALGAWATGAATGYAVVLFILLFLLVVFRQLPEEEPQVVVPAPAMVAGPPIDPLTLILASFDGLDMPIFVMNPEAELIAQNQAAEKVFGALLVGLHVSTRWRSPGILDMIRETTETGAPNQIEHSERHPSSASTSCASPDRSVDHGGEFLFRAILSRYFRAAAAGPHAQRFRRQCQP